MEKKVVLISIIVPVYKVERYLRSCLDSIRNQTFTDFELILVDDGSPDACGRICDEYRERDERISVIHQVNSGVTAARRSGVKMAQGKYICFVDADDTLPPNALEELFRYAEANALDICMGRYVEVDEQGIVLRVNGYRQGIYTGEEYLVELLRGASGAIWGHLYRREFVDEKVLEVPADITWGEDLIMKINMATRVHRVGGISSIIYHYVQRADSAAHVFKRSFAYEKRYDYFINLPIKETNRFEALELLILKRRIWNLRRVLVDDFDCHDEWLMEIKAQSRRFKLSARERLILFCATNFQARKVIRFVHRYRMKDRLSKWFRGSKK